MQDIVLYVAANETLGKVREYSNMRGANAPLLTLGVAVCLRMRLFDDIEVSTPYPIASFNGITEWQWSMDADFNRSTACKLVADTGSISVHSVSDTVNGETLNFTEFVIPISNMNTEELAAWLGNEGTKSGLTGELVGYDNDGHAVFVLQIENFSVRNRVAGLGDPTALDQEIVTRTQTEQMIQMAVSASAATKQDKLTSSNAGTGISISSAGAISIDNVPQSAVTGLESALSNKQNTLSTGFWIEIDDDWISVEQYHTIHGPYSRGTVSMLAGEAYKVYATNSAVTLDAGNIPSNTWGLEGHAEIFVANTGYVQTTSRVVLANALEPDAVNNCTVRFHDGLAIISVEDHVAGYIVVSATGTTAGTLPYGISTATQEYVAFDATLDGSTIDLSGSTANGEKHIVGNGYTSTTLTGAVDCGTSKFTVANLSLQSVAVNGGTMTLGDVFIPSGSTVAVSGGGLAIEKVVGEGESSVIDLGGTQVVTPSHSITSLIGLLVTNGTDASIRVGWKGSMTISSCTFSGNVVPASGAIYGSEPTLYVTSCVFKDNLLESGGNPGNTLGILLDAGSAYLNGNSFASNCNLILRGSSVQVYLSGSNYFGRYVLGSGSLTLTSGAVLDLTGNENPVPVAPGGGIKFESGGATVLYSSGAVSGSYMMDNVTLPAGAKLTNTAVIDLGSTKASVPSVSATASGCIFSGSAIPDGLIHGYHRNLAFTGCTLINGGGAYSVILEGDSATDTGHLTLDNCIVSAGAISLANGGDCTVVSNFRLKTGISAYSGTAGGKVIITSGAILDLTGNLNGTPINPGGGIVVSGGCTVINSAGASVSIAGGTYATIKNDGTTTE